MHLKFGTFPNQAAHMRSGRGGTHALCAVHGRRIYNTTNVKALPESLGKCTLLEILCVPPPPARLRGCGNASAALLCVRAACRAGAGPPRLVGRGLPSRARARQGSTGADGARVGMGRNRSAVARAGTRPTPSSRRCRRRSTGPTCRNCECPSPRTAASAAVGGTWDAATQPSDHYLHTTI